MSRKTKYLPPLVLQQFPFELEGDLLGGSVVNQIEGVHAVPQETVTHDFSDPIFNHSWEGGDAL